MVNRKLCPNSSKPLNVRPGKQREQSGSAIAQWFGASILVLQVRGLNPGEGIEKELFISLSFSNYVAERSLTLDLNTVKSRYPDEFGYRKVDLVQDQSGYRI